MDTPTAESLAKKRPPEDLLDLNEPDAAFLLATEQEDILPPRRRALVVLVSDHETGEDQDTAQLLSESLMDADFQVDAVVNVRCKKSEIRKAIETAVVGGVDLVLTAGGTGVRDRDKTPEATRRVLDQQVPGIAEALRASGQAGGVAEVTTSRGVSGVSGSTVVVNLPDSPQAFEYSMPVLTPLVHHLIDQLQNHEAE